MRLNQVLASGAEEGEWQTGRGCFTLEPEGHEPAESPSHCHSLLFPCSSWKESETLKGQLPFSGSAGEELQNWRIRKPLQQ